MKRVNHFSKLGIIAIAMVISLSFLLSGCSSTIDTTSNTDIQKANINTNSNITIESEPVVEPSRSLGSVAALAAVSNDIAANHTLDPTSAPSPTETPIPSPTPTPTPETEPDPVYETEYEAPVYEEPEQTYGYSSDPEYYYETEPEYYQETEPEPEVEEEVYYEPEPEYYDEPEEQANEEMVYVSRKGECYHCRSDCSNMKNPSYMPLSEAEAMGRRPCSKCYG